MVLHENSTSQLKRRYKTLCAFQLKLNIKAKDMSVQLVYSIVAVNGWQKVDMTRQTIEFSKWLTTRCEEVRRYGHSRGRVYRLTYTSVQLATYFAIINSYIRRPSNQLHFKLFITKLNSLRGSKPTIASQLPSLIN